MSAISKILGKRFRVKKILVKNVLVQKNIVSDYGPKKFWIKMNSGLRKFLIQNKVLGPNIFLGANPFSDPNIFYP